MPFSLVLNTVWPSTLRHLSVPCCVKPLPKPRLVHLPSLPPPTSCHPHISEGGSVPAPHTLYVLVFFKGKQTQISHDLLLKPLCVI